MERRIYKLTKGNEKKISVQTEDIDNMVNEFSENTTGKNKGLKVRDYKLSLMAQTREYIQGCWQGKLDRVSGLDYSEERNDSAYNLGYYRGYNENPSGYKRDAIQSNPNFEGLA